MTEAIESFTEEYEFLSNFYPAVVEYEGIVYPTSEHAFQAAKTLVRSKRLAIAALSHPRKAKYAGRRVPLRHNWEEIKVDVMREVLIVKFSDPTLAARLANTAPAHLVEGNTHRDQIWGAVPNGRGQLVGRNLLGKLLMQLRDERGIAT